MSTVSLHYWAGARDAAGTELEQFPATSIADALARARGAHDARFSRVLSVCTLLVDGVVVNPADVDRPLDNALTIEVLPPFAGG